MSIAKSPWIFTALLLVSNNLRADFVYTFSFDQEGSFPSAMIEYSSPTLPQLQNAISIAYSGGAVNGCAPTTINALYQDPNTVIFGMNSDDQPACPGNQSGVVGFAFATDAVSNVGTYLTSTAGRAVEDGNGFAFHFTGGQLVVAEQPVLQPVPEPSSGVVIGALFVYFVYRRGRG